MAHYLHPSNTCYHSMPFDMAELMCLHCLGVPESQQSPRLGLCSFSNPISSFSFPIKQGIVEPNNVRIWGKNVSMQLVRGHFTPGLICCSVWHHILDGVTLSNQQHILLEHLHRLFCEWRIWTKCGTLQRLLFMLISVTISTFVKYLSIKLNAG